MKVNIEKIAGYDGGNWRFWGSTGLAGSSGIGCPKARASPGWGLFDSMARDAASGGSDMEVLVAFDGPAASRRYFGVRFYLGDLSGWPVDLVAEKGLCPSCAHTSNKSGSMSDSKGRKCG